MNSGLIAVTGATGHVGGAVARRLARAGVAHRLVVRDATRAPRLSGIEVAVASGYDDVAAMHEALRGVSTLLLVSAAEAADRVALHSAAIDAAVSAGVRRIVYTSFVGAGPQATFTLARDQWRTEEYLRASDVAYTFLRDSLYQDYVPNFVGEDDVIRGPAGEGRVAAVARADIADVATAVLLADGQGGHDGRTYDVTGPWAFTLAEAAEDLTRAVGREITYQAETLDEAYASRAGYGAPPWEVTGWVSSYAAIATGEMDVVSDTVAEVAGHEPVSLAELLAANPPERLLRS